MAENLTLARPYAEAAYGLAADAGAAAAWLESLERLVQVIHAPEAQQLVRNPTVGAAALAKVLADAAGGLTESQVRLLEVMAENHRLPVLPEVLLHFRDLKNAAESVLAAEIQSAFPLSDADVASVVKALTEKFGRPIRAAVTINAELIGGISVVIGDQTIDASVRGKLQKLATALTH